MVPKDTLQRKATNMKTQWNIPTQHTLPLTKTNTYTPYSSFSLKGPYILLLCRQPEKKKEKKKETSHSTYASWMPGMVALWRFLRVQDNSSHSKTLWVVSGARLCKITALSANKNLYNNFWKIFFFKQFLQIIFGQIYAKISWQLSKLVHCFWTHKQKGREVNDVSVPILTTILYIFLIWFIKYCTGKYKPLY